LIRAAYSDLVSVSGIMKRSSNNPKPRSSPFKDFHGRTSCEIPLDSVGRSNDSWYSELYGCRLAHRLLRLQDFRNRLNAAHWRARLLFDLCWTSGLRLH